MLRISKRLGYASPSHLVAVSKLNTVEGMQMRLFLNAYEQGLYSTVHNHMHPRHIRKKLGLSNRQYKRLTHKSYISKEKVS